MEDSHGRRRNPEERSFWRLMRRQALVAERRRFAAAFVRGRAITARHFVSQMPVVKVQTIQKAPPPSEPPNIFLFGYSRWGGPDVIGP